MSQIPYFLEETGIYLRENKMTLAMTTLTIAFAMLMLGLFIQVHVNLSLLMENLQSEIRVLLYLNENITSDRAAYIREAIEAEPEIVEIRYISKKQALLDFVGSLKGSELLLKGLGEDPLPASFELTVDSKHRSSEAMAQLVNRLKGISGIEEIQYGREWVENIERWLRLLRIGAIGIGGLLAFTVTVVIANAIQLTLLSRRNEMEILKLIGATKSFIGVPFILEGTLIGLMSSVLALLILAGLYQLIRENLISVQNVFFGGAWISFLPIPWILGLILMGVGLGCIGSYWSIRRWI